MRGIDGHVSIPGARPQPTPAPPKRRWGTRPWAGRLVLQSTDECGCYESGVRHQLKLMCDDIDATIQELRGKGIEVRDEPEDGGFGITTTVVLPGGAELMLYEP